MAEYRDREAFIPYRRADLIKLCIQDGRLSKDKHQAFRDFCEVLAAYCHMQSHHLLEELKDTFAPFNPDADTKRPIVLTEDERDQREEQLVQSFETVLQHANYSKLSDEDLEEAFRQESLIPVKTKVDFEDYKRVVFYYRGDNFKTMTFKRFWFWNRDRKIDNLERVALLLKFKDEDYFKSKKLNIEDLNFTPGKMYLYLYKNIPRFDLELLFPNVKVSMNWRDRLLFGVPAIGAAVPLAIRVLPSLLLVVGAIIILFLGLEAGTQLASDLQIPVTSEEAQNLFPILVATLSIGMTLGGFAFKQYSSYKNKRLKFLKQVADTLFFKNLVSNAGVLYTLVDSANEERCKEMMLVYYHLLTAEQPLTKAEVDDRIEEWMEQQLDTKIDFDIRKTLDNLAKLQAPLAETYGATNGQTTVSLVNLDDTQRYQALPLHDAKAVIDYVWDNVFQYTTPSIDNGVNIESSNT